MFAPPASFAAASIAAASVAWVVVAAELCFDGVACCPRCRTTVGRFAVGFAGAVVGVSGVVTLGVVAVGVGVLDVEGAGVVCVCVAVGVVLVVVSVAVVSVFVVSVGGVSVVEVVVVASPALLAPSEASTVAESGPSPAAVRPPPAITEISARQNRLRLTPPSIMRRASESSGGRRPIGRGSAQLPHKRGIRPATIHIGRQARASKGFVIEFHNRISEDSR